MAPAFIVAMLMAAPVSGASPSGNAAPVPGEPAAGTTAAPGPGAPAPPSASMPAGAPAAPGAPRGLVVVLVPEVQDEVTHNAMTRITGELTAAPFNVSTQPVDPTSDVMGQVETAGRELGPVAAFAIVPERSDHPTSVAVWVSNRITHTTTVQRVPIRAGDVDGAAAHLAIEAVELVRASMAGLWPGTKSPVVEAPPPPRPAPLEARFQVGVGVSAFGDFDGGAPTFWAPALNVSYGRADATRGRLSLVGLGPGTDVTAPDGSGGARLDRAAAELGVVHAFRAGKTVEPLISVGVGGQRLTAQGTGMVAPARLHRETAWSAMGALGAGALLAIGSHLAVVAEAQGVYLLEAVAIRVNDMDIARVDRLTFNAEVGLLATF